MSAVRHAIVLLAWLGFAIPFAQAQIAYKGHSQASVAAGQPAPTFVGAGAVAASTGAIAPPLPSGLQVNDILLLFLETRNQAIAIANPNGGTWALVANSPQGIGDPGSGTRLTVFWSRYNGTQGAPTTTASGDHQLGRILAFRGVATTGDPWDVTAGGTEATADTSGAIPGATTTVANTLVVTAIATALPDADGTAVFSGWTNANLTGLTELTDNSTSAGNGGGLGVAAGVRAATGSYGTTSVTTSVGTSKAMLSIALRPPPSTLTISLPPGTLANDVMIAGITYRPCSGTSGGACTTTITPPAGWTQVNSVTDQSTGAGTGGFGNRLFVYRRVAGGSEPASYTWTFGGTPVHAGAAGGIISFSGVDTANPIVAEAGQATASSTSHAAPSINTGTVTNTMLVSTHSANSSAAWTPPTGMTERVDAASLAVPNNLGISVEMNHQLFTGFGATGTRTAGWTAPPAADTGIAHMLALRPVVTLHHYAISFPGGSTGVTCDPHEITITGHDSSHNAVAPPAGTVLNLSTSTSSGVWTTLVSGSGTWKPSGLNNGAATYTWPGGETSFTVRLRHNTPVTLNINLLDGGGRTEGSGAEDPNLAFADAAFRVTDSAGTSVATFGTHIAGKRSDTGFGAQTRFLQAIRTDTNTGSCVALIQSQTVTVEMAGARINPTGGTSQVRILDSGGTMVPVATSAGAPPGSYTGVSLAFDAQSKAPLVFDYPDAGSIAIYARYQLPAPPAGTFVSGNSNTFVVRPFGLRISGVTASASPSPSDPAAYVAGQNFNVTLTAVAWKTGDDADANGVPDSDAQIATNAATPNFGQETPAAQATLSHTLNAPSGGNAGTLGGATTFTGFVSGAKTQAVNWSEVGFINLFASSTNYLGSGQNVTNSSAGLTGVGRFRPAHFALAASGPSGPVLTNRSDIAACADTATTGTIAAGSNALTVGSAAGFAVNDTIVVVGAGASAADLVTTVTAIAGTSFTLAAPAGTSVTNTPVRKIGYTYLSEPARVVFTLNARNAGGTTTQNYTTASGYAKLSASAPASFNFGAVNGTANLTGRTSATLTGDWIAGAATFTAEVTVSRAASPDGPFNTVRIGIAPADSDGVQLQAAALNLDVNNDAVNDRASLGTTRLRFGRLALRNANGSQLVPLRIPVEAQYWNGTAFVTNTEDHCTPAAASTSSSNFAFGGYTGALANCKTALSNGGALSAGRRMLLLAAPGAPNHGSLTLTFNLGSAALGTTCTTVGGAPVPDTPANLTYLRGNWTGGAYDQNPSARATFGTFPGAEEVIFIRENFK